MTWSCTTTTSGAKDSYYGGVHPHHDHLHIELTQEALYPGELFLRQSDLGGGYRHR